MLVESVADAEALELPADARLAYITQTTLSVDETREIIDVLRRRFPQIEGPAREDICYATSNRQWAVKELLDEVGLLLVVGSRNSSNSVRLVEVAHAAGVPAHLVDDAARSTKRGSTASTSSASPRARPRRSGSCATCATGSARAASTTSREYQLGLRGRRVQAPGRAAPRRALRSVGSCARARASRRLDRLPEQYFTRAARARRRGRGARRRAARRPRPRQSRHRPAAARGRGARPRGEARPDTHGYAPFAGLPALKEAIAARYRVVYGVEVDPAREVAVLPGSKTGLMEFAQVCVERGDVDRPARPRLSRLPLRRRARRRAARAAAAARRRRGPTGTPRPPRPPRSISTTRRIPLAACAPDGVFEEAIDWAHRAGAWVMHDFAYGDLVFDGRKPASFLAVDGAREVGFELFSMSKSYGMAGWRLGFAVGNAEIVARIEELQNHQFAGVFMPVQEAGIAALTGPQESVEARRALYEARRDRALAALAGSQARAARARSSSGSSCPTA